MEAVGLVEPVSADSGVSEEKKCLVWIGKGGWETRQAIQPRMDADRLNNLNMLMVPDLN